MSIDGNHFNDSNSRDAAIKGLNQISGEAKSNNQNIGDILSGLPVPVRALVIILLAACAPLIPVLAIIAIPAIIIISIFSGKKK